MPNPTTKQELLAAMADGYAQLNEQIANMSDEEISASGLSLAHQAVGMGDVVFHSRLCNAVEAFARVTDYLSQGLLISSQ